MEKGFLRKTCFRSAAPRARSCKAVLLSSAFLPWAQPLAFSKPPQELPAVCSEASGPPSLSTAVRELLGVFPLRQFVFRGGLPDLSKPGALDLFSGGGGVARSLVRHGCPWVLCFVNLA